MKVAYLSSRLYGKYATNGLFPEPVAYEDGFGIKWLIEDQINGDPALSCAHPTTRAATARPSRMVHRVITRAPLTVSSADACAAGAMSIVATC